MSDSDSTTEKSKSARRAPDVRQARTLLARIVGAVLALFAGVLALAALLIVLEANLDNSLIRFIGDFANAVDLGVFDLDNPIKEFGGGTPDSGDLKKIALLNYGLGAIVYLIASRVADRAIRP
ncbi:hypothetical protein GCM10027020_19960 [Nocardioides salsibiostraticola]